MKKYSVTILITSRNRKNELGIALDSCLRQSDVNEIFVIDDGSNDGTHVFVISNYPEVRIERIETSIGIVRARNFGIERVKSEVVLIIDDDCEFKTDD